MSNGPVYHSLALVLSVTVGVLGCGTFKEWVGHREELMHISRDWQQFLR